MRMELVEGESPALARFVSDSVFRDKELLLSIPGMRFSKKHSEFRAPLTWATAVTARGIFGERLELSDDIRAWGMDEAQIRINPSMAKRDIVEYPENLKPYHEDLYTFQNAGVDFLNVAENAILGDEMGTGKTVQIASLLSYIGAAALPALVIAPKSAMYNWKNELARWAPELSVEVIAGTIAQRRKIIATEPDVLIINWEGVRGHSRLAPYGNLRLKTCTNCDKTATGRPTTCEVCEKELNKIDFATVIADEAHRMKDPKAKQTRAVWAVSKGAYFRYALTGTPLAKNVLDFWSILHFVNPREWPSRTKFIDRWCEVEYNPWSGGVNVVGIKHGFENEFFKIVQPRMRRMQKEIVLPFLPPKTVSYRHSEMNPKQKTAYKQMAEHMMAEVQNGLITATNSLTKFTRLSQFASAMVNEAGDMIEPSNKIETFFEIWEDSGRAPMVVFAVHRDLIEMLARRLDKEKVDYSLIVGGQTADQREMNKADFQESRTQLILCTIQAGSEAITLTRAGTAVFLERSWSMVQNKQAEDRVHRIGSDKLHDNVQIIYVVAPDTIEVVQQNESLFRKAEALEQLVQDNQAIENFFRGEV